MKKFAKQLLVLLALAFGFGLVLGPAGAPPVVASGACCEQGQPGCKPGQSNFCPSGCYCNAVDQCICF